MGRWCWQEDKVWLRGGGEAGGAEEPEEIGPYAGNFNCSYCGYDGQTGYG